MLENTLSFCIYAEEEIKIVSAHQMQFVTEERCGMKFKKAVEWVKATGIWSARNRMCKGEKIPLLIR